MIAARTSGAASDRVALFHQRYANSFSGRAYCSPATGNASANDEDIGINLMLFFVIYGVGPGRRNALFKIIIVPFGHEASPVNKAFISLE